MNSQVQQSLQRRQRRQRWLSQASFVQETQMSLDGSPQMLQVNRFASLTTGAAGFGSWTVSGPAGVLFLSAESHDNVVPPHWQSCIRPLVT